MRFTITSAGSDDAVRLIIVCEMDSARTLTTSLYCQYGFDTSAKPAGFIDPFGDIERYGPVGDPISLAVLSPGLRGAELAAAAPGQREAPPPEQLRRVGRGVPAQEQPPGSFTSAYRSRR